MCGGEDGAGIDEGEVVVGVGGEELRADVGGIGDGGMEGGVDGSGGREVGELYARYPSCRRHWGGRGKVVKILEFRKMSRACVSDDRLQAASHRCFRYGFANRIQEYFKLNP